MMESQKQPEVTTQHDVHAIWEAPKVSRVSAGEAESGVGAVTEFNAGSS